VVIHSVSRRFKEVERMANIKSAMKRVKVNKVKAAANKARKSELKTVLKKANLAAESGANKEEAIKAAIKRVDQACAKGLLHKNNAARKKAQLAKKLNG
jgi:small subunit ribosomal protein S20